MDGLTLKDLLGPLVLHFVAMLICRINESNPHFAEQGFGGVITRDSSVLGGCAAGQFIYCRINSVSSQMTARANRLRLLLNLRSNVDARNKLGRTPLFEAVSTGCVAMVASMQ